jgi:putative ABC transport system permease protein
MSAATWAVGTRVWTGAGPARQVLAIPVSANFFDTLGVRAQRGRTFAAADEAAGCSVVASDRFWRSSLGADSNAVGRSLVLDGRSCVLLGITPPSFSFYPTAAAMWMLVDSGFQPDPERLVVGVFARLKPGVTRTQAQQELTAMHAAIHAGDARELELAPVVFGLHGEFTWLASRDLPKTVMVLAGAVCGLLLIACVNVANLLLARWAMRHKELTVRAALGAGSWRIARQVLGEGLWLSAMAAALGSVFALAAVRYFQAVNAVEMPVGAGIAIRWPVLLFGALLCAATTLITGLLPAWRASKVDLISGLKAGRGSTHSGPARRSSQALIAAEMAASVVLLWGAGLLMKSVMRMGEEHLGFDARGLLAGSITLPRARYGDGKEQARFWAQLEQRAAGTALVSQLAPYGGGTYMVEIAGREPQQAHDTASLAASASYFEEMRVPLVRGRFFEPSDRAESEPVAIVNRALAQTYFEGGDPVGRHIRLRDDREVTPWLRIVGVVGNEKHWPVLQEMSWVASPALFRPLAQDARPRMDLVTRTGGSPGDRNAAVERAIAGIDPGVPLTTLETMDVRLAKPLAYPRFRAALLAAFSVCALLLAAVGLYGVLAQLVAFRAREFGVRRAVGARARDLILLVASLGGVPVGIGLALGIGCALALGRVVGSLLYGLQADDPATLAAIPLVLLLVAASAMAAPALRAARIDPMTALREE